MSRVRDLLYRFRPAGAPGAATAAGVPLDRAAALEAELAPLFAQLEATEHDCDALEEQATRQAAASRTLADQEARDVLARARKAVVTERVAEAARYREKLAATEADTLARAEAEAAQIRQRGSARVAGSVDRIVEEVDRLIGNRPPGVGT